MLKKTSLVLSVLYTTMLTAFSLIKLKAVTQHIPSFSDKAAHTAAHFLFVILWFFTFRFLKFKYNRALSFAALFSFGYGILIELLQGWFTVNRESDLKDVYANVLGMIIAVILLISVKKRLLKNNNTLLF